MREGISVVVLAGGKGSRIGGNKHLLKLQGKPLLEWVIEAIRPQCDEILISADEPLESSPSTPWRIIPDRLTGHAGPLAGLQAGMHEARNDLIASVPCDAPFLPQDLVDRLCTALGAGANAAIATVAGMTEPAFALYRRGVQPSLDDYLASGGRKMMDWQNTLNPVLVEFNDESRFFNINTVEDLAMAEQRL